MGVSGDVERDESDDVEYGDGSGEMGSNTGDSGAGGGTLGAGGAVGIGADTDVLPRG